jgi:hypothetical protein
MDRTRRGKLKLTTQRGEIRVVDIIRFGEFADVICYSCGTPGHYRPVVRS